MDFLSSFDYIAPILQITLIDLLLSGDNALVIAMACAHLPSDVRRRAMVLGTFAAIFFRVILTLVATVVLRVPYLKLAGALALLWIGISLLVDDDDAKQASKARSAAAGVGKAIAIIVSADLVMSLDNVIAVAAAAEGHLWFLILGLLGSIPVLLVSSVLISRLLDAYPFLIRAGGGLLGWIAGRTAVTDPAYAVALNTSSWGLVVAAPVLGALYVLGQARLLRGDPGSAPAPARAVPARKESAPAPQEQETALAAAPSGTIPKKLSRMDMAIMAGIAVPVLLFLGMILFFVWKAVRP